MECNQTATALIAHIAEKEGESVAGTAGCVASLPIGSHPMITWHCNRATVSPVCVATNRTAMQDRLFSKIVEEIKHSKGELAWATSSGGRGNQANQSA